MKALIRVALIASFATPLARSAGTVKVYAGQHAAQNV